MTNPTVVSVAENHFVPLLIHNNTKGYDATVLKQFKEPAWSYQVIRFLDSEAKDIIPRKKKVWTTLPLLQRMKKSLLKQKRTVPTYLDLAIAENNSSSHKTIAISQFCFWTGEAKLGQIPAVIKTEAGWFDKHEVTLLTYDSSAITIENLLKEAKKLKCADTAYIQDPADLVTAKKVAILPAKALDKTYRPAKASSQKKQINTLDLPKNLSMAQLTKFNSFYYKDKKKAASFLTESQQKAVKGL